MFNFTTCIILILSLFFTLYFPWFLILILLFWFLVILKCRSPELFVSVPIIPGLIYYSFQNSHKVKNKEEVIKEIKKYENSLKPGCYYIMDTHERFLKQFSHVKIICKKRVPSYYKKVIIKSIIHLYGREKQIKDAFWVILQKGQRLS